MRIPADTFCWNAYLKDNQEFHALTGSGLERLDPQGCRNRSHVAIETIEDIGPGPRWYCIPCAIGRLRDIPSMTVYV